MNQLSPYEKVIADKFSHAAIPDMADEIWASIETELGPNTSGDDGSVNEPPASSPSGTGWATGFKYLIVALVTITVLFIVRKRNANKIKKKNIPVAPAIEKNINKGSTVFVDSLTETSAKYPGKKTNGPAAKSVIDSSTAIPTLLPNPGLVKDTITVQPPVLTAPATNSTVIKPYEKPAGPPKKEKGVKGIKDDDYKIIPKKKDSL